MRLDLAEFVLQNVAARALQHAERTALKPRRVLFGLDAASARFHADHLHGRVVEKRIKQADGVGAAADAREQQVGQTLFLFQNLRARLVADDALEIPHHHRIRMRAIGRAEDVMRAADVRHPVAHRLVDGFLQGLLPRLHRHHFRAEHFHAVHIQFLPLAIHRAHVDDAFQAEHRGDRRGGHAVLARAGFGDDARLAHAPGQQDLADGVVDLVRAGVVQILALEIDFRAAQFAGEPFGKIQRRGPSAKFLEVIRQFALKFRVLLRAEIFRLQLLQRMHQRLRHITSAVRAKMALGVGQI